MHGDCIGAYANIPYAQNHVKNTSTTYKALKIYPLFPNNIISCFFFNPKTHL